MELDLLKSYAAVKKRIGWIVLFVLIVSVSAGLISEHYIPPVYQAQTKLLVTQSQGAAPHLDINTVNLNIRLIDTYKEIIRTPAIMNQVVAEHPEFQLTSEQLIDKVKVSSVNETPVMSVAVEDHSYDRAMHIANAVADVFRRQIPLIMKVDNVTILNEALPNDSPVPVKPDITLNVVAAFIVSLTAAVGYVVVKEYVEDTVKTEEDIAKHLDIPTFAVITHVKPKRLSGFRRRDQKPKVGEMSNAKLS